MCRTAKWLSAAVSDLSPGTCFLGTQIRGYLEMNLSGCPIK